MESRRIAIFALVVALGACVGVAIVGWSLWPLGVLAWLLLAVLLAPRTGYTLALVGALVSLLAIETVVLRALPLTGLNLALSSDLIWGGIPAALSTAIVLRFERLLLPSRGAFGVMCSALAAPALGGFCVLIAAIASGSSMVSWSMANDAAWTTISAQHIAADGGINTATHPNPSPLMSALMAVGGAPGRASLPAADVLRSDIVRNGQLWVLVILATSFIIGLIVARAVGPSRPAFRLFASFILGCLPFSWYLSGFAVDFGFYSASLATLLLICGWALWQAGRSHPLMAFCFLLLLGTDMLATWALLVVVPLSLACAIFLREFRQFFDQIRPAGIVVWMTAVVQFVLYAVFVTLPDFKSSSAALSAGGGIQSIPPLLLLAIAAVAILTTFAAGRESGRFDEFRGTVALVIGMAAGLELLIWQAQAGWSYYPTKFAWLASILLLVVIGSSLAPLIRRAPRQPRLVVISVVASLVMAGLIYVHAPPIPPTITAVSPLLTVARGDMRVDDALAARLFSFARPGRRILLSRYGSDTDDHYVNFWLLQITSRLGSAPIRNYAYTLLPTDAKQVCEAIVAWHGQVTVETTSPGWGATLRSKCPNADFTVQLHR